MEKIKFNDLSFESRASIVLHHGNYLKTTDYELHSAHLYEIAGGYVEVIYNLRKKMVTEISSITYKELDLHISDVSVAKAFIGKWIIRNT
jgi:hypothetical protein